MIVDYSFAFLEPREKAWSKAMELKYDYCVNVTLTEKPNKKTIILCEIEE